MISSNLNGLTETYLTKTDINKVLDKINAEKNLKIEKNYQIFLLQVQSKIIDEFINLVTINIGHTKLKLKEFSVQNRSRAHSSTQLISDYVNEDASRGTFEILVAVS